MFNERAHDLCRVLVVDDDVLVRARLSAVLNATRYEVEVAGTGEEALRVMDSVNCHIVVTDWHMPDMDGLALCRHIRLRHQDSYIYVLMLSIRDTWRDVSTGLAAGADAYVFKSAPIDDILARMEIGRRIAHDRPRPAQGVGIRGASYVDPVTGAYNLQYLAEHLPREMARSQRHGHCLSILRCQVDGFEAFREQFGHGAGNDLLREFVACAVARIRKGDWFARASCASFWIVLPETSAKGAQCAAKQFQELFEVHAWPTTAAVVSVNISVTALDAKHDDQSAVRIASMLWEANQCMDVDRQSDRDRARIETLTDVAGIGDRAGGAHGLN